MKYITALLSVIVFIFIIVATVEARHPGKGHVLRHGIPPPGRHGGRWLGGLGPPSKDERRHHG
uniref:Uncharacterized protein n=1 Tax=Anopheles minimus TaxID=112268 RepID=A0A1Y9IV87_9DIPT